MKKQQFNECSEKGFLNGYTLPKEFAALLSHSIGNPAHSLQLSLSSFEKIWNELIPVLDSYRDAHGDFELGGYLYSELKQNIPVSLKRAFENATRIKRIVHFLQSDAQET